MDDPLMPPRDITRRAWVVISRDGRVGYIDHYKSDGRFGVRPVQMDGRWYPNPSPHWTEEQRNAMPEELALALREFTAAADSAIPQRYRSA